MLDPEGSRDEAWTAFPRVGGSTIRLVLADTDTVENGLKAGSCTVVAWTSWGIHSFNLRACCRPIAPPSTNFIHRLHLRQRLTEQEFTEALKEYNFEHHVKTKLEGYTVDASNEEYPITVQVRDLVKDAVYDVQT